MRTCNVDPTVEGNETPNIFTHNGFRQKGKVTRIFSYARIGATVYAVIGVHVDADHFAATSATAFTTLFAMPSTNKEV